MSRTALVFLVVFGSDQVSKLLARGGSVARLNPYGALAVFEGRLLVVGVALALVVLVLMFVKEKDARGRLGLAMILSAGLSNLFDRLVWGGVWDFIDYNWFGVIGNLADVWLGVGVGVVLVGGRLIKVVDLGRFRHKCK